ncbi:zinc finger BED domain-containing protein RICESLEEPER 2-like protein, partial [Tanacetum coccineum]
MSQDDQVIGDEDVSNEEFQTNKRKQTIVDEQPKVERTKKSKAWCEFERVKKNGITKMKCNHCSSLLAYPKGGTTTTLNRHLEIHCSSEPGLAPAIVNGKYDHIKMRESIAHYILMHEHSFSIVEEAGFNFMIKVGIPQWPRLSRTTEKNKCVKVYENQKKKLKDMLKKVDSITLTTDIWKSKCQKIGYMVIMDCKTLWNSTYEMLVGAYKFGEVFPKYDERDSDFDSCPLNDDWVKKVKQVLDGKEDDENQFIQKMVNKMKEKFDKYWAEVHLLMAIAAVLDPRVKMWSPGFCFPKIYNPADAKALIEMVEETLKSLHSEKNEASPTQKSDLDVYFEDGCYMCAPENNKNFNILDWWKNHELKYRILSKLAHDILAISITTVASEATFSAGN